MNKTRTAAATVVTTPLVTFTAADALAMRYVEVKAQLEELESERQLLSARAKELITEDGSLTTSSGTFRLVLRTTLSWTEASVKAAMPTEWKRYLSPDDRRLRLRLAEKDMAGCLLETLADKKTSEALIFYAK